MGKRTRLAAVLALLAAGPAAAHAATYYVATTGITGGYADGSYHPERVCTRDQMAVFMAKAFGL